MSDNSSQQSGEQESTSVLGVNLTHRSAAVRFAFLSLVVFAFFLGHAYQQELFFSHPSYRPHSWYLTFAMFCFYTAFGVLDCLLISGNPFKNSHVPIRLYFMFALLQVATMGLSNQAAGYLNYPTLVMFKSAKLLPVLFGSVVIQGKRPQVAEWLAAICMSMGITLFLLADVQLQLPIFHPFGVALICLALCADAAIGNVQEGALKMYNPPPAQILLFTYGIGSVIILAFLYATDSLLDEFDFASANFSKVHSIAFAMSILGFLGQLGVLGLVQFFGAYIAATVTTARKAATVGLSFLLFAKPFSWQYVFGFLIFSAGAFVQTQAKPLSDKMCLCCTTFTNWLSHSKNHTQESTGSTLEDGA